MLCYNVTARFKHREKEDAMATKNEPIVIPAIDLQRIDIKVVGDSPLIMHKWSEKAKREMLDKQMKVAKSKGHDAKDPEADFINSMYWLDGEPEEKTMEAFNAAIKSGKARFGFPSTAFKASAVSAAYRAKITKDKVSMNGAFHILGEMVEIEGIPQPRTDMVRVGMGTADIRFRGEFPEWSAILPIQYNAGVITVEQIANMLNMGGFACGVGEWRPEKGGSNGMYHVE